MAAFDSNAGTKLGTEIWRIEKMNPVRQDEKTYGTFYSGDAYILLQTIQKPGRSSFEWNLHFWLGKDCSQDEQGAAAYRTVELDDQLGGGPIQFREVQGHESNLFSSYFKSGIKYLDGGIESAFNHVEPDKYEPRLLHLKGKRDVRCMQVEMKASNMNEGDVFILDNGLKLYQWNGKNANKYEKFKALEVINKINAEERGGRAELVFLDSGKNDAACADFWTLAGDRGGVQDDDGKEDVIKASPTKLFRISDATGKMEFTQEQEATLNFDKLDTNDCFLADSGTTVYVWVGKGASKEERKNGMKYGTDYLAQNNRPPSTQLMRIAQTGEPPAFKQLFCDWPQPKANAPEEKGAEKQGPNTNALYERQKQVQEQMASLEGTVEIWRINDFKKEPLDKNLYGQFWAGDSFLVLYTYKINSKTAWIIYFWQGRDSSLDEKGASALLAKEMDDELGGDPVQVRVVQNKEPQHFLALFKGKMVVHEGGVASGFKNKNDTDSFDTDGISLFHVKGRSEIDTRAVQVAEKAASLNSGDCFVLLTPDVMYVWQGEGANDVEQKTAHGIADMMKGKRSMENVKEGSEPEGFWSALGGQGDYSKAKELEDAIHEPRLFRLTCNVGHFHVEEIFNFVQDDLINDDVMMLDVYTEIFLWVGEEASKQEKDESMKTAMSYVQQSQGHDKDTPIFRVSARFEPPNFTSHFLGWDAAKAGELGEDPYLKQLEAMGIKTDGGPVQVSDDMIGFSKPGSKAYTLADLKGGCPAGVDPKNKELYLGDDEFATVFGTDKSTFTSFAAWKKTAAKKKAGLF